MSKVIKLVARTVYILVGPSGCGKSSVMRKLAEQVPSSELRILSSDDCRNVFTAETLWPHDPRMMEVSGQAFNLLQVMLDGYLSYPVQIPFVFVDTTGFDTRFRQSIQEKAKTAGYRCELIIFDYQKKEYLDADRTDINQDVLGRQIERFKRDVLPELNRSSYDNCTTIRSRKDSYELTFEREPRPERVVKYLPHQYATTTKEGFWWPYCPMATERADVTFIGDVHERVDELKELLIKIPSKNRLYLIGDWIDKGGKTKEIIDLLYRYSTDISLMLGNHEFYVMRRLMGMIENPDLELEKTYFTSLEVLLNDKETADKFLDLALRAQTCVYLPAQENRRTIIATHSPCMPRDVGNFSNTSSVRAMINLRRQDFEDETTLSLLDKIEKAYPGNGPWRVVGHVAHDGKELRRGVHWYIDTGVSQGNKLTAVTFHLDGRITSESVAYSGPALEEAKTLLSLQKPKFRPTRKDFNLDDYQLRTLNRMLKGGTRYISGTMAPAPAFEGKLEPLRGALDYFRSKGVEKVILEPKHMGSRGQVYMNLEDLSQSYITTRSGTKMRDHEGIIPVMVKNLYDWLSETEWFKEVGPTKEIVLDCEIMPWAVLGKSLIDKEFIPYGILVAKEVHTLVDDPVFASFKIGEEYQAKQRLDSLKVFADQVMLFGDTEKDPWLEPFAVLMVDDVVSPWDPVAFYTKTGLTHVVVDLSNEDSWNKAEEFFHTMTNVFSMEGVVVKPTTLVPGCVPYMKVRNENYLHMVYGYDYQLKYDEAVRTKKIFGKARLSLEEFNLANELLATSLEDKAKREDLICEAIFSFQKEASLDPRL